MASSAVGQRRRDASRSAPSLASGRDRDAALGPDVRFSGECLLLRSPVLFDDDDSRARRLIDHAFVLDEVRTVAVHRERGQLSIELAPLVDARAVWRRLGALIRQDAADVPRRAARLDLRGPTPRLPVRIGRAGNALTTFHARLVSQEHLRIGHPLLRERDIRRRFIDTLLAVHGVTDVRPVGFRRAVLVAYDPTSIEAEQILRLIEGIWPEITGGPPVAPRPTRLFVAGGLLAVSFVAQFLRPALLPWATGAVVLYSLPNFIGAIRDLARGRIGLYALYSAGLGFLLWTRLPFTSTVMATLSQLWPSLARELASKSERKLFSGQRRRLAWARLDDDGQGEILVGPDQVTAGATVIARAGDFLPADGIVIDGHAAIDETMLGGARGAVERLPGDPVYAGTFVRDGALTLRVTRAGPATAAAALVRALPSGALKGLPSSAEAERIANRNAKPALAAAAALLLATRGPRLSQVVIRPDYATAPRLSAHLSALTALAEALAEGALIRRPSALDRLSSVEAFIFDDGTDFVSRAVDVKKVNVVRRSAAGEALGLAAAALAGRGDPRAEALKREIETSGSAELRAHGRQERAGETTYRDDAGALVSITTPSRALSRAFAAPLSNRLYALIQRLATDPPVDPAERPLVVARDRRVVGVVQFARQGERRFAETIVALRQQNPQARFVHMSSAGQPRAEAAVEGLGFDAVFGGLSPQDKARTFQSLGLRAAWIGDGTALDAAGARAASAVSISLAGLDTLPDDDADIVLLRDGLRTITALRPVVDAHQARLQADYRTVYLANVLAVTGGFLAGFGSLGAGLTSNLGSATVFLRRWRELNGLSAAARRVAGARHGAAVIGTSHRAPEAFDIARKGDPRADNI